MAGIELEHVTKAFAGGVVAVDDVSLSIADGEFMVLVGPSGCGKSTLLRMIAGLEEITDGTIAIGDVDITELPPPQRDIVDDAVTDPHHPVGDRLEPRDHPQQRRLAATRRPDEHDELARADRQVDAVDDARVAVRLGDVAKLDVGHVS